MKNLHRIRISIAASVLVLTAMSSSASAQPTREEYCNQVAWDYCSWQGGHPTIPTFECIDEQYTACMNGFASLDPTSDKGDRRRDSQLA